MIASEIDLSVGQRSQIRGLDAVTFLTIYLVLLFSIPSRLVFSPLGGVGQPATIFAALLFGRYLLEWIHPASALDRERQPMRLAATLWFCVIVAVYVSANLHPLPVLELNGADRGIIQACAWLGILLYTVDSIGSIDALKTLLRRIVFGATAMAALGFTQFFTGLDATKYIIIPGLATSETYSDLLGREGFNRPSATAIHPIEFGVVLAMCLPLAIHQARYAQPGMRWRRWLQVALIAATLPMTVSRSAILGLLVSLIVILPTWPKRDRHIAYLAIIGGTLVLRATIPGLIGTLRGLFFSIGTDSSTVERTKAYSLAAPLISHHPWLGQGFGTFLPQTNFFTDDQYLGSLIETGVVGLLALLLLFATGWFLARGARRASTDDELRHLAQCLAASVAVAVVSYATFDAFGFPIAAGLTFLLLGCTGAMWRLMRTGGMYRESSVQNAPASRGGVPASGVK